MVGTITTYMLQKLNTFCPAALLKLYRGSPAVALLTEFPEVAWKPWSNFSMAQKRWWTNLSKLFLNSDPIGQCTVANFLADQFPSLFSSPAPMAHLIEIKLNTTTTRQLGYLGGLENILTALHQQSNPGPTRFACFVGCKT